MQIKVPIILVAVIIIGVSLFLFLGRQKTTSLPNPSLPEGSLVEIEMEASQFRFDPPEIRVKLGDRVRLKIKSVDVAHGISIPAFGVSEVLPPGETKTIEFVANKRGTFDFLCSVYCGIGHSGMRGRLIVE